MISILTVAYLFQQHLVTAGNQKSTSTHLILMHSTHLHTNTRVFMLDRLNCTIMMRGVYIHLVYNFL